MTTQVLLNKINNALEIVVSNTCILDSRLLAREILSLFDCENAQFEPLFATEVLEPLEEISDATVFIPTEVIYSWLNRQQVEIFAFHAS